MNLDYRGAVPVLLLALCGLAGAAPAPALLLLNGRVWTGNPRQPWAEAFAVAGERIVQVGSTEEIRKLHAPGVEEIDARGRLVIPGFNDAHTHFLSGSVRMSQVDLTGAADLGEMQRRIAAWAKAHPEAKWIAGGGWEYTRIPGGLPHKRDLDQVTGNRPAFLSAYDGHTGWANSAALEQAGIRKGFRFSGYGGVVAGPDGEPTGALKEDAQALVSRLIPPNTREQNLVALRLGLAHAARLGITSITNASGGAETIALFEELRKRGELTVRTGIAVSLHADAPRDLWNACASGAASIRTTGCG